MKTHNKLRLISLFLGLVNPSLKSLKNLLFSLSFVLIVQPLLANSGIHSVSIGLEPSQINLFQDLAISSQEQEYIETLTSTQQSEYKALSVGNQKAQVLNWLVDSERRENNEKPRLEMRMCFGHEEMYANIALCCKDSGAREVVFPAFKKSKLAESLHLVKAGRTTIEISSQGVDKSTPIKFLQYGENFKKVLTRMGYQPGPTIDAMRSRSVIVSDADGTIWAKPAKGMPVESSNLFNSEAKEPILSYLKQGGVLMLNTGNDPARTVRRFLPGMAGISDAKKRRAILSRVIFASAGGGSLSAFIDGRIQEISGYHKFDPSTPVDGTKLDMLYLGDDAKLSGNDIAGFQASQGHYICVASITSKEHVAKSGLEANTQYGEVRSTHDILTAVVLQAQTHARAGIEQPLFQDMPALLANTRNIGSAREITEQTIHALGSRQTLDRTISEVIDRRNLPFSITAKVAVSTIENLTPPARADEALTYSNIMKRASTLPMGPINQVTQTTLSTYGDVSIESAVNAFLDNSDFMERSKHAPITLRILEPGNNDQSTPMHVASQILYLKKEFIRRGGDINNLFIQVIVMGKGGHAITSAFPQIGQIIKTEEGQIFSGTEEAIALGQTLLESLKEHGILVQIVTTLDGSQDHAGGVSIQLETASTNTGENVRNSIASYKVKKPDYQWVSAATSSSKRQTLTFAHQYGEGVVKYYDELWSMPVMRSGSFVSDTFTDFQAVAEFYAGLAEQARLVLYAMKPNPYIPLFTNSPVELQETLDSLYDNYARLEGLSSQKVKKNITINDLLAYFGSKFSVLEQSIPWSKVVETQQAHVRGAIETLTKRKKKARAEEVRKGLALLGDYKKQGVKDRKLKKELDHLLAFIRGPRNTSDNLYTLCNNVNVADSLTTNFMSIS